MRRLAVLISMIILLCFAVGSRTILPTGQADSGKVELYFVDSAMLRLVTVEKKISRISRQSAAEIVINELIRGRDDNKKILRIIPNIKRGMSVRVRNNIATVNLTKKFVEAHSAERQHELLTVYQIVNSLTSIDGIELVKFTVDGRVEKSFKGFIDMRESFIPDYYI